GGRGTGRSRYRDGGRGRATAPREARAGAVDPGVVEEARSGRHRAAPADGRPDGDRSVLVALFPSGEFGDRRAGLDRGRPFIVPYAESPRLRGSKRSHVAVAS